MLLLSKKKRKNQSPKKKKNHLRTNRQKKKKKQKSFKLLSLKIMILTKVVNTHTRDHFYIIRETKYFNTELIYRFEITTIF